MMNRNKNTETITTITDKKGNIFRTDASFNPATVDEICIEFMANYCISRGTEDVEWLKAEALKKSSHTRNIKDYETGERKDVEIQLKKSFRSLRKSFVKRYFKNLLEKPKKELDHIQKLNDLLGGALEVA